MITVEIIINFIGSLLGVVIAHLITFFNKFAAAFVVFMTNWCHTCLKITRNLDKVESELVPDVCKLLELFGNFCLHVSSLILSCLRMAVSNIASIVKYDFKEAGKITSNEFIVSNLHSIADFLDEVCTDRNKLIVSTIILICLFRERFIDFGIVIFGLTVLGIPLFYFFLQMQIV